MRPARMITAVLATTVAMLALAASASAATFIPFQTPSGNIGCIMGGGAVRCDIRERNWTPPPKPADCDVDWAQGVAIGRTGEASFVCAGDTAFDPNAGVLDYGGKIRLHRFKCASKTKGVRCVNRKSDHGFFLSREEVRFF